MSNPSVIVIDNFVDDALEVRQSVINAGVGTWLPKKGIVGSSVYEGMGYEGKHASMVRALSGVLGGVPIYPNRMFFRVTNTNTEPAYVHSDRSSGDFTCIVYLSEHVEPSGTSFYRHKDFNLEFMPKFEELAKYPIMFDELKQHMVWGETGQVWEKTKHVEAAFNRAIIFDAPLFHSRVPASGIGTTLEEGRLIWACHFNLK